MLPFIPLFAMHDANEIRAILAFFGPFWLMVITVATTSIVLYHRRRSRERELGAEMIRDMLGRKMTADEIERVLYAWTGRRAKLKKFVQAQERAAAAAGKPPMLASAGR